MTSALRQVEECHARKEAELLKMELEQVRLQVGAKAEPLGGRARPPRSGTSSPRRWRR